MDGGVCISLRAFRLISSSVLLKTGHPRWDKEIHGKKLLSCNVPGPQESTLMNRVRVVNPPNDRINPFVSFHFSPKRAYRPVCDHLD